MRNLTRWSFVWPPRVWQCWKSYNRNMFFIHRFLPCRAQNQQDILTSRLRLHTILLRDLKRSKTMLLVLLNLWAFLSLLEDTYVWNTVSSTWEAGCFNCFTFDCQAYELSAGHGFTALICNVQGHDHCCCRGAGLPDLLGWCCTTANSGDVVHFLKTKSPEFNLRAAHGILFKDVCIM